MGVIYEVDKIYECGIGSVQMGFPVNSKLSSVFTKKWLRLAKAVKEVENPCYSRQIGVVIVDPNTNSLVSSGHNGPPEGCPKNDDPDYLRNVVWPQLTPEEKVALDSKWQREPDEVCRQEFVNKYANCKTCPRKPIGALSGKRLELCTCIHGEVDAIIRANRDVSGCYMICYCGVPCIECTKVIINAGIDTVVGINHGRGDYSPNSSRWLFEKSRVNLILVQEDWIWKD
jgi:deoxycytidylate deaminase